MTLHIVEKLFGHVKITPMFGQVNIFMLVCAIVTFPTSCKMWRIPTFFSVFHHILGFWEPSNTFHRKKRSTFSNFAFIARLSKGFQKLVLSIQDKLTPITQLGLDVFLNTFFPFLFFFLKFCPLFSFLFFVLFLY